MTFKFPGIALAASLLVLVSTCLVLAAGPLVSQDKNKHNLSSAVYNEAGITNPSTLTRNVRDTSITYKATFDEINNPRGRQVCIFCHTPHSANNAGQQTPLWNRSFSSLTFSRYSSSQLRIRIDATTSGNAKYTAGTQPDGASKLCLSCHDGASRLGDVLRGGPITMAASGGDIITGRASFHPSTNKMKVGHHPVSFVYDTTVRDNINTAKSNYTLPSLAAVKLDRNKKMQCTTCHDPHQNQSDDAACYDGLGAVVACNPPTTTRKVAPFWTYHSGSNTATADHDAVCTTCHPLTTPSPWP